MIVARAPAGTARAGTRFRLEIFPVNVGRGFRVPNTAGDRRAVEQDPVRAKRCRRVGGSDIVVPENHRANERTTALAVVRKI